MNIESGCLKLPAVMVHGGAGEFGHHNPDRLALLSEGLFEALCVAFELLSAGAPALEASVAAVASLESSGNFNAGRGAVATSEGTVETDAAVMDGSTRRTGAICSATWPESPIGAALEVMKLGGPEKGPVLLAGRGADRFCENAGLQRRNPAALTGEGVIPISSSGTVGAVTLDLKGHLAAATSTGGLLGQMPGRVGDSPVVGAGTWADDRTVAVSATGEGESFLVAGFAHLIDWTVGRGKSLDEALGDALAAVRERGGQGGAIVLANDGRFAVGFDTYAMAWGWRDASGATLRDIRPSPV